MSITSDVNMSSSAFCVDPLETHPFSPSRADDFLCESCHKPRALHLHDGFTPSTKPSALSDLPMVRYRGWHPYAIHSSPDSPPQYENYERHLRIQAEAKRQRLATEKLIARIISTPPGSSRGIVLSAHSQQP